MYTRLKLGEFKLGRTKRNVKRLSVSNPVATEPLVFPLDQTGKIVWAFRFCSIPPQQASATHRTGYSTTGSAIPC